MSRPASRLNFALMLVAAWALVSTWLLLQFWSDVGVVYADPDDAMRLAQVHGFLGGQGWFDLNEARIDPPHGYLTHWSRLIDAGLAGVYFLFRTFADATLADRLMQATWPLFCLLAAMGAVAAIAWRCAGREAAVVAVLLAVFGLPAFQQFRPGRIDHHNVQIALALLAVAAVVWSDRKTWAAVAAGLLSALALAVGLESLPWIALTGAAMLARFVVADDGGALQRYGFALTAGTAVAFGVSVPPALWTHTACDAIAINIALPAIAAGLCCVATARVFADAPLRTRLAGVGCCGVIAIAIFAATEPRCLGGPFAMMDPDVRPIWLAQVREMQPLARFFAQSPMLGIWVTAFPAAALASALFLMCKRDMRSDQVYLTAVGAFALAAVTTITVVKAYSYAMWFGMPLVAAAVVTLAPLTRARAARWVVAAAVTPIVVSTGAMAVAQAAFTPKPAEAMARQSCFRAESYRPLAQLPPGLVVADVDFGPLIVAFTPHAVLAAPYHRIATGIIVANRAFASSPDEAWKILRRAGADYLVLCGGESMTGLTSRPDSLWSRLRAGEVPNWLAPLDGPADRPLLAYRVRR